MSGTGGREIIAKMFQVTKRLTAAIVDKAEPRISEKYHEVPNAIRDGLKRVEHKDAQFVSELDKIGPAARIGHGTHAPEQSDAPLLVADELDRLHHSGARARWANFHSAEVPRREFEAWITSPTEGPLPALHPDSAMNCWEMIGRVGVVVGVVTHAQLHRLYEPVSKHRRRWWVGWPKNWADDMARELLPHGKRRYVPGDPAGPQPQRGDVVMWGNGNHVVVATGRMSDDGSPEVYSFWPPPKDPLTKDPATGSWGAVTDAVQISSIDRLTPFLRKDTKYAEPSPEVWFGRGPW
ncbi:hypothetical protein [Nocardia sp. NPDC049149]|uniref:hypothetical protein n=1 Tax=Nocardia sp. NPDC049149 TaxID=3364315 RepID=UPI0037145A91